MLLAFRWVRLFEAVTSEADATASQSGPGQTKSRFFVEFQLWPHAALASEVGWPQSWLRLKDISFSFQMHLTLRSYDLRGHSYLRKTKVRSVQKMPFLAKIHVWGQFCVWPPIASASDVRWPQNQLGLKGLDLNFHIPLTLRSSDLRGRSYCWANKVMSSKKMAFIKMACLIPAVFGLQERPRRPWPQFFKSFW